jgi:hypothetical protein
MFNMAMEKFLKIQMKKIVGESLSLNEMKFFEFVNGFRHENQIIEKMYKCLFE